jgi:hypothetical protein
MRINLKREKARADDSRLLQSFTRGALKPPCAVNGTSRALLCQARSVVGVLP